MGLMENVTLAMIEKMSAEERTHFMCDMTKRFCSQMGPENLQKVAEEVVFSMTSQEKHNLIEKFFDGLSIQEKENIVEEFFGDMPGEDKVNVIRSIFSDIKVIGFGRNAPEKEAGLD